MGDKIFFGSKVSEIVTEKIIQKLEQGVIPWRKSWATSGLPVNWETRRPYSGINLFLLEPGTEYLTFNQIRKLGAHLKKGAKSSLVVFWKVDTIAEKKEDRRQEESEGFEVVEETPKTKTKTKTVYLLRYYYVFNVEDVESLPERKGQQEKTQPDLSSRTQKALTIVEEWNKLCVIKHGDNYTPSYSPTADTIYMPTFDKFVGAHKLEEYFSTLFHEITHSTGHKNRLNRIRSTRFGDWHYAEEELTAEIGSAMLLNICGLDVPEVFENNAAYISYWLERLRNDKTLVVKAAGRAEKAVDFVVGKVFSQNTKEKVSA